MFTSPNACLCRTLAAAGWIMTTRGTMQPPTPLSQDSAIYLLIYLFISLVRLREWTALQAVVDGREVLGGLIIHVFATGEIEHGAV